MSLFIQNNNGPIYTYTDCTITIHNGQMTVQHPEDITPEDNLSSNSPESDSGTPIIPIPQEGKYTKVREYIKERSRFDEEFKTFVKEKSLRELCARLTKEFGWFVDEHSLGSNLNRHRKD